MMHSLADADYHKSDCVFRFKVPGYKDINREMRDLSVEIDSRRRAMTSPDRELVPYIALNNSTIGYTTLSTHGNCWQ